MTAPGAGFKIADAYVAVHARDNTRADVRKLEHQLRELNKSALINLRAKDDTRAELAKAKAYLRDITGSSVVTLRAKDETRAEVTGLEKRLRDLDDAGRVILRAKDETRQRTTDLRARLRDLRQAGRIPLTATDNTGPEFEKLRAKLRELKRASHIVPTYEAHTFIDAMGRERTRYHKVSRDTGTFIGEVMSRHMVARFTRGLRHPYLFAPILTGAVALMGSAAILAIPAGFAAIATKIQASNTQVSGSFHALRRDVTAALAVDSAPLVDNLVRSADRVGTAFQTLRPQLRGIFDALNPQIDRATDGVVAFARNAMPGLVTATREADEVVDGLADNLGEAGGGVTRFFRELTPAATEAGQTLRTAGVIAGDVLEMFGQLGAAVTRLFGGQVWNEAEGLFESLTNIIGDFAGSALPALGVGLEIAMTMFGGLLNIIEPLAGVLGTWVGTLLGVAVVIRSVSGTVGVLAAMLALLKGNIAAGALTLLSRQMGATGLAASTLTTQLTGNAAAGERVASSTSKVVTGLQKAGNALPFIGAALVGLSLAYDGMRSKAEESARSVLDGSTTLAAAVTAEVGQIRQKEEVLQGVTLQVNRVNSAEAIHAEATRKVTSEIEAQLGRMGPLERATALVALATGKHADAVRDFGAHSPQAAAAAAELSTATDDLKREQHAAEQATKSHTEAIIEQTDIMRGSVDAEFAYRDAVAKVTEAQKAAADAVRDHGLASAEGQAAVTDLAKAMHGQAEAASRAAEAAYAGVDPQTQAAKAAEAYRTELLRVADVSTGPGKQAFEKIAASMNNVELAALSATAQTSGLKTEIVTLPDGRTVTIITETDRGKLDQLRRDFTTLHDVTVTIGADPAKATAVRDQLLASINGAAGTVNINGNNVHAGTALQQVIAAINSGAGTVTINGQSVPAASALRAVMDQINAGHGTVTINGQTVPASSALAALIANVNVANGTATIRGNNTPGMAELDRLLARTNFSSATARILGNTGPAAGSLGGILRTVTNSAASIRVLANTGSAEAALQALVRTRTATINTYVNTIRRDITGNARGNILAPMAQGGVLGFAGGGMPQLSRMSGAQAAVVPANTWRVIGDNLRHPELFAPLDGSRRSLEFIRTAAAHFNHVLVSAGGAGSTRRTTAGGGAWVGPGLDRELIKRLEQALARAGTTVNVIQQSGSPAETGRFVALALRTIG